MQLPNKIIGEGGGDHWDPQGEGLLLKGVFLYSYLYATIFPNNNRLKIVQKGRRLTYDLFF